MKTLALLCSLLLLLPPFLAGQDSLLLRQMEWKWESEDASFVPSRELLFAYDEQGRRVEQWALRVPADHDSLWPESHTKTRWDDFGRKTVEIRELYSTVSGALAASDSLVWAYDESGNILLSLLIRYRPTDSVEQGYRYTYRYDTNGCESSRAGWEWRQDLQQFVRFDSVRTTRRADCLPEKQWIYGRNQLTGQLDLDWVYRFEYEFDAAGRPLAERLFHMEKGLPPEDQISEYRLFYGPGYTLSTYATPLAGIRDRDSVVTDQAGNVLFEAQWSTSFSLDGSLVPLQQYTYTYLPGGGKITERLHSWRDIERYFLARTVDTLDIQPGWQRSSRTTEHRADDGTITQRSYRLTEGPLRCDGKKLVEDVSTLSPAGEALPILKAEFTYASSPACEQPAADARLLVFPNPSQGEVFLRSGLLHDGQGKVLVFNALGMKIWEEETRIQAGLSLRLPALASGWYVVTVENDTQRLSEKVWITP